MSMLIEITISQKGKFSDQAARLISTGQLNVLPRLHTRPINEVVFLEPSGSLRSGRPHLGKGLALRCFQRLSFPHTATRRCH